jgi:DNA-binding transcriptional MerR regulator
VRTNYSIKDLEHLTGIKAHTLRIWEQRYSIIVPKRTKTNIRLYSDDDLKKLLNVSALVNKGWRISNVAKLTDEGMNNSVKNLANSSNHFPSQIARLIRATIDLDEPLFSSILQESIDNVGESQTFSKVVGGFIHQIGVLWQTDVIGVAHEHFASNLIKQKLYTALDNIPAKVSTEKNPGFLVYLPEREMHEIGLLYIHFILKSLKQPVVYLGQSVPLDFLKPLLFENKKWKGIVSIWTTSPDNSNRDFYWHQLSSESKNIPIYLSGIATHNWEPRVNKSQINIASDVRVLSEILKKSLY